VNRVNHMNHVNRNHLWFKRHINEGRFLSNQHRFCLRPFMWAPAVVYGLRRWICWHTALS